MAGTEKNFFVVGAGEVMPSHTLPDHYPPLTPPTLQLSHNVYVKSGNVVTCFYENPSVSVTSALCESVSYI